ncbi:MAG: magnesium transporter [Bacteroidetes bacterium]|nr:magnesium transporter [Bacteroidota bacterium]MDA0903904.1 magnesium transporter [Bacteroidota bacterium]MDA1242750.1 magnesium transporter [Bacteroidota bacterium]
MLELTREYLDDLRLKIEEGRDVELAQTLGELHPKDVADIFDSIPGEESLYLYRLLDGETKSEVIAELEEDVREGLLSSLSTREIAEDVIEGLDSDDAADALADLPEAKVEEALRLVEDQETASEVMELLRHEEGTAGALMAVELIKVQEDWTVARAIREIRAQASDVENIYTIYVVDDQGRLNGRLSLKSLLLNASSARSLLRDLKDDDELVSIEVHESEEMVVKLMERYDLVALPVVDSEGILLGRITIDDAVDVIIEDAERDYQLASGISEDVEDKDSVWTLTRARLPWLLIGLGGGIGGAYVIGAFDIENNPELALFIPLIAAMGGNVGVQSSAIVVQGLASANVNMGNLTARLLKELSVGLVNGLICSAIIFLSSVLLGFGWTLSTTVSASLLCVIVFAALFGAFVPLMLDKRDIDPALATGPFITTANDIMGLIIYFSIGSLVANLM